MDFRGILLVTILVKMTNTLEVEKYVVTNNIVEEPTFAWWVTIEL